MYLEKAINTLQIEKGFSVEFGSLSYMKDSTENLLLNKEWKGLIIEGDINNIKTIHEKYYRKNVLIEYNFVTIKNINNIFKKHNVPKDFDALCIDIDGMDYWIWSAIKYQPKIVCIEYNSIHKPPKLAVQEYNENNKWNETRWFGASLQSLVNLGKKRGYELIGCKEDGSDAFFVKKEYFELFDIKDNSPSKLYMPPTYGCEADGGHKYPDGEYITI
jgi:hypothetical protein